MSDLFDVSAGLRATAKRFARCYRSVVCLSVCLSCLAVTLVYCGQTVGCIKTNLGMKVGLGPGHIALDGDPAAPLPKGAQPPIFGRCLLSLNGWFDQGVAWYEG